MLRSDTGIHVPRGESRLADAAGSTMVWSKPTENRKVGGSIPALVTKSPSRNKVSSSLLSTRLTFV